MTAVDRDAISSLVDTCMQHTSQASYSVPLSSLQRLESGVGQLPPTVRARWLLAHVASSNSPALIAACAQEVATLENWAVLMTEIISKLPPSPAVTEIVAQIALRRHPTHPLAAFAGRPTRVIAAFDMLDDGQLLHLHIPEQSIMATRGYLLSLDAPDRHCSPVRITQSDNTLILTADDGADWLERQRAACPAALLILPQASTDPIIQAN